MVFVMILALSVVLAGFGCSSEDPPMVTEEIISTSPDTPEEVSALPVAPVPEVKKITVKKPMIVKVTKKGDVWEFKLNGKLKKDQEVRLCIGYMYFTASSDQVDVDGTVKIKTGWTPPGSPRVSAGVWNGTGYVTSVLVFGG